jgi:hypothetical protein
MKKYFRFSIILFIISISLRQALIASTLHAIFVTDTIHDINSITIPDLIRWQKELQVAAKSTNMILKEVCFDGERFKKGLVIDYLKALSLHSDDAVIFIFSGHGYRTKGKQSAWPFLMFEFDKEGIDLKWIHETIREKKPRFSLILGDCCNNDLEKGFVSEDKNIFVNLRLIPSKYEGYKQLFGRAKGHILICSCSPGNFSYGSHLGGLYSQCFFVSMNRELSEKSPSWKKILERANGYIQHVQTPICEINH